MGQKLNRYDGRQGPNEFLLTFWCPGCKAEHPYSIPRWTWNGDMEKPTFMPSLLCNKDDPKSRCHFFVREGRIEYYGDCHHELAGKTIDLPDMPEDLVI